MGDWMDDALQRVVRVVATVLRCQTIDPSQSFAALGGTSLRAVHVLALLEEESGVSIDFDEFARAPNLLAVAALLAAGSQQTPAGAVGRVSRRRRGRDYRKP